MFHALDEFSIIFATVYVEVKIGARMGAIMFHALDEFSIIFATVYVEVKIGARMGAILSASAMYMY